MSEDDFLDEDSDFIYQNEDIEDDYDEPDEEVNNWY